MSNIKKEKRRIVKNALIKQVQVLEVAKEVLSSCIESQEDQLIETENALDRARELVKEGKKTVDDTLKTLSDYTSIKSQNQILTVNNERYRKRIRAYQSKLRKIKKDLKS